MRGKKHTRVPLSGKGFRRKLILDVLSFLFFLVSEAMERSEPSEAPGVSWARGVTVEMSGSGAAAASADDEGFERVEMRARRQPALTPRLCHVLPPPCLRNGDPRLAKAVLRPTRRRQRGAGGERAGTPAVQLSPDAASTGQVPTPNPSVWTHQP